MLKNTILTIIIAATVAGVAPRDRSEVAVLAVRLGALLMLLGLSLDPPGYDAGPLEDEDAPEFELEHAKSAASLLSGLLTSTEYFPDTPMPDRPGCEVIRCVPLFDGRRHGKRCYWRCRRPRRAPPVPEFIPDAPAPAPPSHYAAPVRPPEPYRTPSRPHVSEPEEPIASRAAPVDSDAMSPVLLAIVAALLVGVLLAIIQHFESISYARSTEDAIDAAQEAEAARAKLDAAAREADQIIERYRTAMRRKGREDAG